MQAVTFQAPGKVRVEECPDPKLGAADDAIVRVEASGICGSDLHLYHGRIPLKIAMGMLLTGKSITAAEAATLGLVNEVVPLADLMPTAERWARTICECSPLSVQATKQCAYDGLGRPLAEAMTIRYPAATRLFKSEDLREGPRAFAEKRKPIWQGR